MGVVAGMGVGTGADIAAASASSGEAARSFMTGIPVIGSGRPALQPPPRGRAAGSSPPRLTPRSTGTYDRDSPSRRIASWELVQRQDTWLWTTVSGFESL